MAHQGQTLADLVSTQILGGAGNGLDAQASRALTQGSRALDATLASRGIFNSGNAMSQHRQLTGEVLSGLAQARNQDQFQRAVAAGQIFQNPSFQFFSPSEAASGETPLMSLPGLPEWAKVPVPGGQPGFINQGK